MGWERPSHSGKKFREADLVLLEDSLGSSLGGFCNSSSNALYIERAVGISEGGRTGLTTVFAGLFFISAILFSAVASVAVRPKQSNLACFNRPGKP